MNGFESCIFESFKVSSFFHLLAGISFEGMKFLHANEIYMEEFLGLDSRVCIPWFEFKGLDSLVWIHGFGFLGLDS